MNLSTLIIILFAVIIAVTALIYILLGFKKGIINMSVRLALIGVSVLLSILFTSLVLLAFSSTLQGAINGMLTQEIRDTLETSPRLAEYIKELANALVAPTAFLLVFTIITLLLKIPGAIIIKAINRSIESHSVTKISSLPKWLGSLVGFVCAIAISTSILMPFAGYISVIKSAYPTLKENKLIDDSSAVGGVINQSCEAGNSIIVKMEIGLSKPLFNSLTKVKVKGSKGEKLNDEISVAINVYNKGAELGKLDYSDITKIEYEKFDELAVAVCKSDNFGVIGAELLAGASKKWANGEAYLGLNLSTMVGEDVMPALKVLLEDFEKTTKKSLVSDVKSLTSDMKSVANIYTSLSQMSLSGDITSFDLSPVNECISEVEKSERLKKVLAVLLATGGGKWINNESYFGINLKDGIEQDYVVAIDAILRHFEITDETQVCDDLREFVGSIDILKGFATNINDAISSSENTSGASAVADLDTAKLRDMITEIDNGGDMIKDVMAAIISTAGNKWYNNETYLGINVKDELTKGGQASFDPILIEFQGARRDNVVKIMNDFVSFLESYKYIVKLGDTNLNAEDLAQNLEDFIMTVNPDNIDVLKDAVTADMLKDAGINAENSQVYSDIFSNTLTEISEMDEEQKKKESDALNKVLSYAKGDTTVSNDDMVASIVESESISKAIKDMTATEGTTVTSTPEEQTMISQALDSYVATSTVTADEQQTIDAIKQLYGITG